jgi:spermidine/putrescine transport system substrate-binding protein
MPKEGGEFSIDYLAIPKGARNIDLAKEFIKMTLDKKLATEQLLYLLFTPVVDLKDINTVKPLLNNKIIFPDDKIFKNFEEPNDSDERLAKIQKIWTELKSL